MKKMVICIRANEATTLLYDGSWAKIRVKGEESITVDTAERICCYVHGLLNSLCGTKLYSFDITVVWSDTPKEAVTLANVLCENEAATLSVRGICELAGDICRRKLSERKKQSLIVSMLGWNYAARSYVSDEIEITGAIDQSIKADIAISYDELFLRKKEQQAKAAPKPAALLPQNALFDRWYSYSSDARIERIYDLLEIEPKDRCHNELVIRLVFAMTLSKLKEQERVSVKTFSDSTKYIKRITEEPVIKAFNELNKRINELKTFCPMTDKRFSFMRSLIVLDSLSDSRKAEDILTLAESHNLGDIIRKQKQQGGTT